MANTYINRNFSNSGNRTIWTLSMWVKRSKIGAEQMLAHAYQGSNDYTKIRFESDDILTFENYTGGSRNIAKRTNRMFRDTNAFYHFVFVNTPSAQTIYVNGVQETSWRTNTTGNVSTWWNHNISNTMFATVNGGSNYFDGIASHVHFCDGTALAPTVFGETDSTTGEWKIKTAPSFTLGTNGFTILKDGNTITDQSANSNNFSLGGGTITVTKDCPDIVFATLNPLIKTYGTQVFSNGNLTSLNATNEPAWAHTLSSIGVSNGKWYWEIKVSGATPWIWTGIISEAVDVRTQYLYNENTGTFLYGNNGNKYLNGSSASSFFASLATNDIVSVALDLDNNKITFYKNGTATPNATPLDLPANLSSTTVFPATTLVNGASISINFGNAPYAISSGNADGNGYGNFEYAVPSGYYSINTANLAEFG